MLSAQLCSPPGCVVFTTIASSPVRMLMFRMLTADELSASMPAQPFGHVVLDSKQGQGPPCKARLDVTVH